MVCKSFVLNYFVKPFFMVKRPKYDKKYDVSICAIFKNEGRFFKEWLAYHEIVGVNHFYLYDNCSDDNYKEIIQPFIDKGMVTLIDWPYPQGQIKAYEHFYKTYCRETQWVSFLDLDEFVVPRHDSTILEWLKRHDRRPVNLIYWKMFGTSGQLKHDYDKLVTEQYIVSWNGLYDCGKCFINTDYDIARFDGTIHHKTRVYYPLFGKMRISLPPLDQFGHFVFSNYRLKRLRKPDCTDIQINHYWSKSWDVYDSKRRGTDVFFEKNPKADRNYFLFHEERNISCDYSAYRYLIELKMKMNGITE